MKITLKDILEKYDTSINIESVSSNLKKLIVFDDKINEQAVFVEPKNVSLNDLKKPKHEIIDNEEVYTYQIKDNLIVIHLNPNNYRELRIEFKEPTSNNAGPGYYTYFYNYNGEVDIIEWTCSILFKIYS